MEDLKQAYEVLGLPETAGKEELENRYFLLTRRARAQKMREHGDKAAEDAVDLEAITEAYRFIRDYEERQAKAEYEKAHYGKYKGMAGKAQKWDHFFQYYKLHLLIGIIVLIGIGYGIKAYADHRAEQERLAKLPPPDISVMFYGNYFYNGSFSVDTEQLGNQVLSQFSDWKRVIANLTYVPTDMKSEQDMAFLQKSLIVMIDDKSDLFIVDKPSFDKLVPQGAFVPFDSLTGAAAQLASSDKAVKGSTEDDPTERAYGIDLSGTSIAKDLGLAGSDEYIAAIRLKAAHPDNAAAFIQHFLQTKP